MRWTDAFPTPGRSLSLSSHLSLLTPSLSQSHMCRSHVSYTFSLFAQVHHVLVVDLSGSSTVVEGLTPATQIAALKALMKAPATAQLFFSPAFCSNFGAPLTDESTLGGCGVLDGDVLYYSSGEAPEPTPDAKPASPKKK